MSRETYRASDNHVSYWTCHCNCGGVVEVTPMMSMEVLDDRYFLRGHAPLGIAYEHCGRRAHV